MGKHKKVINNDPILKRDYKYQKRAQQRAQQKRQEQERIEKQQKAKQQIAEIQNQVQQQMQQQLAKKITGNKQKRIYKLSKEMFTKTAYKNQPRKNQAYAGLKLNQDIFEIRVCQQGEQIDHYKNHFQGLSQNIKIVKQHRQNRYSLLDKQVKQQIKGMFSSSNFKQQSVMQAQSNPMIKSHQMSQQSNPYILAKPPTLKQHQLLFNSKWPNLLTDEAYNRKQTLVYSHQETNSGVEGTIDLKKVVIYGYKDYVYVENREEETIDQFRHIVVDHMVAHEFRCRTEDNAKGFTHGKNVILCPFFGDARGILQIFQSKFQGYQFINKQKLQQIQQQNDFFRIGISINDKKKSIKYFSNFNMSNFIIGSPVGIKAIVGTQGESQRDYSFLSSVEILYVDRASVIYMQNWDHLIEVVKSMNMMPNSESVCNDITKLRPSVPQLMGKLYRQSIIFTQYNFPELNALKHLHMHNWQGTITTKIYYNPTPRPQSQKFDINFYKIQLNSPKEDLESRFQFFKRKFWDQIHNSDSMKKVVIIVRGYFQYIKLKEFFNRVNASADCISENTKKPQVQSKISQFNANKYRILLLTQRAYYYSVCEIKKFQHILFYSLPRNSYVYFQLLSEIYKQCYQLIMLEIK